MQSLPDSSSTRGRKTTLTLTLTPDDRAALEHCLRATVQVTSGQARRARVVLLRADGAPISTIGRLVGMNRRHIYKWLKRYQAHGLAGLRLEPRRWRGVAVLLLAVSLAGCALLDRGPGQARHEGIYRHEPPRGWVRYQIPMSRRYPPLHTRPSCAVETWEVCG